MSEKVRFPEQKAEIGRIMEDSGLTPDELADKVVANKETIRKYAKGYQKAGDRMMKTIRNVAATHPPRDPAADVGGARAVLKHARETAGLTFAQLAKLTRRPSTILRQIEEGQIRASEDTIDALSRELKIPKEKLMEGSDAPSILSPDGIRGTYGAKSTIKGPHGENVRMIPLLSMAQAGAFDADHTDDLYDYETFPAADTSDRRAFAIKVMGNSMVPRISEGDVVICSPAAELRNGHCAVVRTRSGQAYIKFWSRKGDLVTLESANPDYRPIHLPAAEIARACRVVQRIEFNLIQKQ